ncbi:hypothetical protein HNY73_016575 [Argiope bruennichi]|nr:hypothetical protein HNY73_016575 [Argiope bruennichi]
MKENKLEHTAQYLEDYTKLKEIQADIRNIANELDDITPCPLENCERHTPDNVKQPLQTENLDHTENKYNNPEEMETELPFQPVDRKHSSKRKNSVENPEVTTRNKFQILEEEAQQPRKEIPPPSR